MLRPRLRVKHSHLAFIGRLLLLVLALGLVYYGAMTVLLALKVSPETIESISGYRSVYDFLAGLSPRDLTDEVRLITGLAGLAAFLLFGYLAWRELPRARLTAPSIDISRESDRGQTEVSPRAMQRAAEVAAAEQDGVSAAAGKLDERAMSISVHISDAAATATALQDVQREARETLQEHGLPVKTVDVTVTGYDRSTRRELS